MWEHKKDLLIPKFIIRSFIELVFKYISVSEALVRCKSMIQNKWHNVEELIRFDKENNIPSTFFIAVANGMGLNYSLRDAEYWIKQMLEKGVDVGVHGIAFNSIDDIKAEHKIFRNISGLSNVGIRMHYLRQNKDTIKHLEESGYVFDSSLYKIANPFKVGTLWEFPLHIMDGYIFFRNSRWQNQNLKQAIDSTKRLINDAHSNGINYLTINFHDRYFSDSFKSWKDWYIWLIAYLNDNKFNFLSYHEAIRELERNNDTILS